MTKLKIAKPINILIDCHYFDYDFIHGATVYIKEIYSKMIEISGNKFNFYFAANKPESLKNVFGVHENVFYVKFISGNKFIRLTIDYPRLIKQNRIDFIHCQYISPLLKSCKEIVTTHDVLFNDFPEYFSVTYKYLSNFLFRRSSQRADLLLTVSEYSQHKISEHYDIPITKINITPNAPSKRMLEISCNTDLPDIKKKYALENYILYVSRFEPRKNQTGLLQAYLDLSLWEKGIPLVFIGKINQASKDYHSLYNKQPLTIQKWILHFEQVSFKELTAFYLNAKLFVYPSFAEGFGIPPLEAALLKIPCICSNATAMKEFSFFKHRLFDPHNIEDLKNKILFNIQNNDEVLNEEIKNAVQKKYSWLKSGETLLNLIEESIE